MIFFDLTKTGAARHHSGLMRVSARLARELDAAATGVRWPTWDHQAQPTDWFFTAELFSEAERPGFTAFLEARRCRLAALFHDAIPLKHPHITWPQSVARHPEYMKLLAKFDRVWAISAASKRELEGFWRWQGLTETPPVDILALGADFRAEPRATVRPDTSASPLRLLCVGIVEPRKNQAFLVDVCEALWREGLKFKLHVVGRVNPFFGRPILARLKQASRTFHGALKIHEAVDDATLMHLYATAHATVFPTIAEGCGLPLLESLWMGVPCVCSDLPVLRENADGGGCVTAPVNDAPAWQAALRQILTDRTLAARLTREATARALPTWADAAATLRTALA